MRHDFHGSWVASAVVVWLLAPATTVPGRAQTPSQWLDGETENTTWIGCFPYRVDWVTSQFTGYFGAPDGTSPRVGDVYYARVRVVRWDDTCPYSIEVPVEVLPPPHTQFAIDSSFPVLCYYTNAQGQRTDITPEQGCPQSSGPRSTHYYAFNPPRGGWELEPRSTLEIHIPLASSQPLGGSAANSYLKAAVKPLSWWEFLRREVFVAPRPGDVIFQDGFETGGT